MSGRRKSPTKRKSPSPRKAQRKSPKQSPKRTQKLSPKQNPRWTTTNTSDDWENVVPQEEGFEGRGFNSRQEMPRQRYNSSSDNSFEKITPGYAAFIPDINEEIRDRARWQAIAKGKPKGFDDEEFHNVGKGKPKGFDDEEFHYIGSKEDLQYLHTFPKNTNSSYDVVDETEAVKTTNESWEKAQHQSFDGENYF